KLGISSATTTTTQIAGMKGTYQICSGGILGKFVKQLDIQMDDGNTAGGSMQATTDPAPAAGGPAVPTSGAGGIDDATSYTVCMTF
ncbi:MAG TPA: prepilin-type cleavage/methylation domain-containing protein, partial [Usitatibacter sp.]